jgi:hypothetical protein
LFRTSDIIPSVLKYVGYTDVPVGFVTTLSAKTIACSMAEFAATYAQVPKHLAGNVTLNVGPGTVTSTITVQRHSGPGTLAIIAVDASGTAVAAAGTQTHKVGRIVVQYNTNAQVTVQGFTATADDNTGLTSSYNSGYTYLAYCNAVAGSSATTANVGFSSTLSTGVTRLNACTFTNKYRAANCEYGRVEAAALAGSGNATVYRAANAGLLAVISAGTIAGTTRYSQASGGAITGPLATGIVGMSTNKDPNSGWVWRQYADGTAECWRRFTLTGSAANTDGALFRNDVSYDRAYPFTFSSVPCETGQFVGTDTALTDGVYANTTTQCGMYRRFSPTSKGAQTLYLNIHARGQVAL